MAVEILSGARRLVVAAVVAAMAASCSDSPPASPTPPPVIPPGSKLSLHCPTPIEAILNGSSNVPVTYSPPEVVNGVQPVVVTCTPESGSLFSLGQTAVTCQGTDAVHQSAACSFTVTVEEPKELTKTRFVAFGDSVTEGFVGLMEGDLAPTLLEPEFSYPTRLELLLVERYPRQRFTVINRGRGGERVEEGAARIEAVLDQDRPEVLLLLEGYNNLRGGEEEVERAAGYLKGMATFASGRNISVLLATLTPVSNGHELLFPGTRAAIDSLNEKIAQISHELRLGEPVDLFTAFGTDRLLLGGDGFHPSESGYQKIAETFLESIRDRFEIEKKSTDRQ